MYRYIILSSIKKIQYERSVSAVYYLLQGKQSIQTIQDAHLFELSHYYRICKQLKKSSFMKEIELLVEEQFLQRTNKEARYELTEKANTWLDDNKHIGKDLGINGMKYHQIDDEYLARLLLLIQVWTNGMKKQRTYIPIIETAEVKFWVKSFYQQTKDDIPTYLQQLYNELVPIFESIKQEYVDMFTLQLTSYNKYGLAAVQVAQLYQLRNEDVDLITLHIIHRILNMIETKPAQFKVLHQLTTDLIQPTVLTYSAAKTESLLQQGWTLEQIAIKRQLKINTIHDHIVEIAIRQANFDWQNYLTKEEKQLITAAIQQTGSYTLKAIKLLVGESISYFQIRLVLASWNKFIK